jgi:hypothetical protein
MHLSAVEVDLQCLAGELDPPLGAIHEFLHQRGYCITLAACQADHLATPIAAADAAPKSIEAAPSPLDAPSVQSNQTTAPEEPPWTASVEEPPWTTLVEEPASVEEPP